MLNPCKHADLPVGDMAGDDTHPPTSRDRAINMLEAMRLDAPPRLKDAYFPEVRVFGRDAPEIAPHAADEVRDLGLGKLGKGAADVAPSMSGTAEKGANAARQAAADGGSAVERQKLEHAEKNCRSPGLQTIGEPGGSNRKVRLGQSHCRGRYHNGREKPSKLRGIGPSWQSSARCRVSR